MKSQARGCSGRGKGASNSTQINSGAWVLGPRQGRFDHYLADQFKPSSNLNVCFGTMALWMGW